MWNVSHWKLHVLILMLKIWFSLYDHVPFNKKELYRYNPNVTACLTQSTNDLFALSLPFVDVAKLIIIYNKVRI